MYSAAQYRAKLATLAEERIATLKDNLANRGAVPNYETYTGIAGEIAGLAAIEELCEQAHTELNDR